ncbi:MAG: hypothetical protein GF375_03650 [Candidatus Omnitrophica bacterium]|nr:hypothetical protein [Candidatus Omnitrophota bacterium]MBD3269154.1 hypothetical protein [Candidatus Omnitrophota bacterium]
MGIFGLSRDEKIIWRTIRPQDKVIFRAEDNIHEVYFTKVLKRDDSYLYIATPTKGISSLELSDGTPVNVEVYSYGGGKIKFNSKVVSQEWLKEKNIKLSKPRKIEKIQLRWYYRLEIALIVEFSLFDVTDVYPQDIKLQSPVFSGVTKNISEGGLLLIADRKLEEKTFVNVKIELSEKAKVMARAEVLRANPLPTGEKYAVGLTFVKMKDEDRDALRRFIFHKGRDYYERGREAFAE